MKGSKVSIKMVRGGGLILLLFIHMASSATAEQLRLVTLKTAPYGFTEQGKTVGIIYEVLNLIAETAGFIYTNRLMPFARITTTLESGEGDLTITLPHEAIKKVTVLIAPINRVETIVIGVKGTFFPTLTSLHGKTVGILRTASYDKAFIEDDAIIKYEINNYEQSFKMLMAGRVDAIAGAKEAIYYVVKKFGYTLEVLGEPLILNTTEVWLLMSRQTATESVISRLKLAVEHLKQDNKIQPILNKYLASPVKDVK